jgi:hypothetical protein
MQARSETAPAVADPYNLSTSMTLGFHTERGIWVVTTVSLAVIAQSWARLPDRVDRRVRLGRARTPVPTCLILFAHFFLS